MNDNEKRKNIPLPSLFSNIRNAGRSSLRPLEIEPLMSELSSSPPSPSHILPTSKRRNASSLSLLFDKVQAMPLFDKSRTRIPLSHSNKRNKRGFKVDLPPKFLLYTICVFFVLPLVLGGFFIVKQILFGSLQEDEAHPLHRKKPHLHTGGNMTNSSNTNNALTGENITDATTSNQRLIDKLESPADKELGSDNPLQTNTADTMHRQEPSFSDVPSESLRNESSASQFPTLVPSNNLEEMSLNHSLSRI
mmetsp:Transcript_5030/g.9563  ORF Transcript_5030/g.9563 Transcript_5030/m.9563 type:complete len:249 (-) Transcript_5030:1059-1805(-)|eukprot:CAMPEP_0176482334 /NCGR_PEP_ID=MMETSP0200_2-20121128/3318_1 /TAXON_ID=947934 /ORGANISM="Chaetoceros sp., Strain GSL56" /LENGTH=248 /DNA_ID=CAMNT_0017878639 /DNA_START=114 /DNA_END=860 /DNA_ORIENTATION=+